MPTTVTDPSAHGDALGQTEVQLADGLGVLCGDLLERAVVQHHVHPSASEGADPRLESEPVRLVDETATASSPSRPAPIR